MSKRTIWAIIGLMSMAVLGLVALQVVLINASIQINEERFQKSVLQTMDNIRKRLQDHENEHLNEMFQNGFSINAFEQKTIHQDGTISIKSGIQTRGYDSDCQCESCMAQRRSTWSLYKNIPLDERLYEIGVPYIKRVIAEEVKNLNLKVNYEYGVYWDQAQTVIFKDGKFVFVEPGIIQATSQNLFQSEFRLALFPDEEKSKGALLMYFPKKRSIVWQQLGLNLLGTILLSSIILFGFGYTIYVILRQKKVNEMKTDFINNMTHEFKTPIATISLAADSITSPMIAGQADKVQRFANIIKQENKRMNSQVEKVLQMAQIDKRDFTLKISEVDINEIIEMTVENMSLTIEKREGTIEAILDANPSIIQADMLHISNIVNNLLDNANKYSPNNPEIKIHTRNVSGGVEFTVEDKGMGISKEARKLIFDKFYRVPTGDLHDIKGFGLGLSYVKAIVTAHKGSIEVKSEVGKGSSFTVFLPHYLEHKQS